LQVSIAFVVGGVDLAETTGDSTFRLVKEVGALRVGVKRNGQGGLGAVITSPQSKGLIDGVQLVAGTVWPDDRGYFLELLRWGQSLAKDFAMDGTLQVSAALSYPGTIKAIHFHMKQTDLWTPALGMFQVMLCDLRIDSPSFGQVNTIYVGSLRPLQIRIPPGVGHGYKIVGTDPAMLVYATDKFYDPEDEGRVLWNDPDIKYDWEAQKK
jgi:dTDP-4-dehydrorhamnose 3,5-epimerase